MFQKLVLLQIATYAHGRRPPVKFSSQHKHTYTIMQETLKINWKRNYRGFTFKELSFYAPKYVNNEVHAAVENMHHQIRN